MRHHEDDHIPWLSLSVLVFGGFMVILQASAVNVAIPRLMAVFNTSAVFTPTIQIYSPMQTGLILLPVALVPAFLMAAVLAAVTAARGGEMAQAPGKIRDGGEVRRRNGVENDLGLR
ncbi:MAG: hypothetical protein AB1500_08660 [Bacillota bacterium]